jgi:hypothetical protein
MIKINKYENNTFIIGKRFNDLVNTATKIMNYKDALKILSKISYIRSCGCIERYNPYLYDLTWKENKLENNRLNINSLTFPYGCGATLTIVGNNISFCCATLCKCINIIGEPCETSGRFYEFFETLNKDKELRYAKKYKEYQCYNKCVLNGIPLNNLKYNVKSDITGRSLSTYKFSIDRSDNQIFNDIKNVQLIRKKLRKCKFLRFRYLPKEIIYQITDLILIDVNNAITIIVNNMAKNAISNELLSGSSRKLIKTNFHNLSGL